MKRILFICSGNMYRSAGAEFILRKKLAEAGVDDWIVDSAGTLQLNRTGRPEDFGRILAEKGYEFGGVTKYVYEADAASADLILVMDPQHQYALRGIVPQEQWDKIQLFMMYCFGSRCVLTDPSGFFSDGLYRDTRDTLERGCDVIVEKIKKQMMIIEEMTIPANDLSRFVQAQDELFCDYVQALKEVQEGYKYTHWIWYIFPQLRALGHSRRAKYFGIADMDEAVRYMEHPVLSARLREISGALLEHKGRKTALKIFGEIDSLKVRSCMTLFDAVCPNDVFSEVLNAFYDGQKDNLTLELLSRDKNRNSFTNNQ